MDRYWLLTWTTYGSWLPGDPRNFVSGVRVASGKKVVHNIPGTPYDADAPGLERHARTLLKGDPVRLRLGQAEAMLDQFLETAEYRGWQLLAVGIMANHVHLVVGVPGDPPPEKVLGDFKSYASRTLNGRSTNHRSTTGERTGERRASALRWWTKSGSKRKLPNDDAVLAAVQYVLDQEYPLLIWTASIPELDQPGGRVI